MKVTWVHPSWRDLVIDHLAGDDRARGRFLRDCSQHGAQLALSHAGGDAGRRDLPLLRCDADWDALTDRLYELAPALDQAELTALIDSIANAVVTLEGTPAAAEADALARAVLARQNALWNASHQPIALPALEAWLTLAKHLSPRPPHPDLATTWAELLPACTPDLDDRMSLERFADWLTLAELLHDYDPELLQQLGFPGGALRCVEGFLAAEPHVAGFGVQERERAAVALARMRTLFPSLAHAIDAFEHWLGRSRGSPLQSWPDTPPEPPDSGAGRLDVERVLMDL